MRTISYGHVFPGFSVDFFFALLLREVEKIGGGEEVKRNETTYGIPFNNSRDNSRDTSLDMCETLVVRCLMLFGSDQTDTFRMSGDIKVEKTFESVKKVKCINTKRAIEAKIKRNKE